MSCTTCPAREILNNNTFPTDIESSCQKLGAYDWLNKIPGSNQSNIIEVRFKNTHKDFFINEKNLKLERGDYIAVSAEKGHDIGQVSLTGRMALLQIKKKKPRKAPSKIVYRKATKSDLEKWQKSRLREKPTLIKARQIAERLNLDMKISDIEYQGDGLKATFYYIADGRVDFRELIKLYAKEFNVKIEMRQIGARQEAAMVGGIGSCGKELCCSTWRTNLSTISTNAAKIQELPHNAQKLTGQCSKLKCCLMYELDNYLEAQEDFPDVLLELELEKGIATPVKKDLLKKVIYYSLETANSKQITPLSLTRVKEIIQLNKKGIKPEKLISDIEQNEINFTAIEAPLPPQKKKARKNKKGRSFKKSKRGQKGNA